MKLSEKMRGHSLYVGRTEMNQWMKEAAELEAKVKRLQDGLKSIADNTCCRPCQEAALVAKQTLAELAATDKGEG